MTIAPGQEPTGFFNLSECPDGVEQVDLRDDEDASMNCDTSVENNNHALGGNLISQMPMDAQIYSPTKRQPADQSR